MIPTRKTFSRELSINRADKEPAYLLHYRPYLETSLIGYFFTREHGIVHILIKGARRPRGCYALLQHTLEVLISWSGKSSLKTLRDIEQRKRHPIYDGGELATLLYLGEILMKLIKPHDAHPSLYDDYDALLTAQAQAPHQRHIRHFEQKMFAALGYAVPYTQDYKSGEKIVAEKHYIYEHSHGFTQVEKATQNSFGGKILLALGEQSFQQPQVLRAAKRLSRLILYYLMENKPLVSHQLFNYKRKTQ